MCLVRQWLTLEQLVEAGLVSSHSATRGQTRSQGVGATRILDGIVQKGRDGFVFSAVRFQHYGRDAQEVSEVGWAEPLRSCPR